MKPDVIVIGGGPAGMMAAVSAAEDGASVIIRVFALSRQMETRSFFSRRSSAPLTSKARSETGNTRFPRSVFSGTPSSSKKAMTSALVNWLYAL